MRFEPDAAIRQLLIVVVVALAWLVAFKFNAWMFSSPYSITAHWIFLPAALRPLAVLAFGGLGACGLVLGALLTAYDMSDGGHLHEIVLAVSSGLLPWAAVAAGKSMFHLSDRLAGLRPKHIVALCAMCAGANAIGLNAYLWLAGRLNGDLMPILTVFVGDALGAAIVLPVASTALAFVLPRRLMR